MVLGWKQNRATQFARVPVLCFGLQIFWGAVNATAAVIQRSARWMYLSKRQADAANY